MTKYRDNKGQLQKLIFCKYRTVNGIVEYPKNGKCFVFWVDVDNLD